MTAYSAKNLLISKKIRNLLRRIELSDVKSMDTPFLRLIVADLIEFINHERHGKIILSDVTKQLILHHIGAINKQIQDNFTKQTIK